MTFAPRSAPALVAALLTLSPAFAEAQSYECSSSFGTSCADELVDAHRRSPAPASTPGIFESTLTVLPGLCADDSVIVDVDVELDIVHSYVGDLSVDLIHPDGTLVRLLYRPGIGFVEPSCPGDDVRVTLDDEGEIAFDACGTLIPALEGRARPWNPLALFDGHVRNGTWRLRVTDNEPGERGVLRGWTLHLPCTLNLPIAGIEAVDGLVSERGDDDTATLRVTRAGDTSADLEIRYQVAGTASREDIEELPGTLTLPAGSASATFDVHAVADDLDEIDETVVITLADSARYEIGPRASAQVLVRERSPGSEADAGSDEPDASVSPGDAGARQVLDAGNPGGPPDESCGCYATHDPRGTGARASLVALALLALAFGRRRGRPRSWPPRGLHDDAATVEAVDPRSGVDEVAPRAGVYRAPPGLAHEDVRDGLDDGQAGRALQPEELPHGVHLEEHVPTVGRDDEVAGGVVEPELADEGEQLVLHVGRQRIGPPGLEQADAVPPPVERGLVAALGVDRRREHALPDDGAPQLDLLVDALLERHGSEAQAVELLEIRRRDVVGEDHVLDTLAIDGEGVLHLGDEPPAGLVVERAHLFGIVREQRARDVEPEGERAA